jgi:hypothetical protein
VGTEEIVAQVDALSLRIKEVVEENPLVRFKQHSLETLPKPASKAFPANSGLIFPSRDPCFMYKNNPVYCGLESVYNSTRMHEIAIDSANCFCYFAGVVHIYNAVKQLGLVRGRWENLEAAMDIHIRPLFRGSLPTTKQQIYQRLCLMLKVPVANFACNARRGGFTLNKDADNLLERDELSTYLSDYIEGTISHEQLLFAVHTLKGQNAAFKKRELTQIQKLGKPRDAVSNIIPKLDLDLVTLSRKCKKLLILVRRALKSEAKLDNMEDGRVLGDFYTKIALTTASDIICYTYDRDCVAKCTCGHHKKHVAVIHGNHIETPDRMKISAGLIEAFLEEANTTVAVEPFDVVASAKKAGSGL